MHVIEVEAEMADVVQAKPPGTRERMSSREIAVLTVRPLTESPAELSLRKDQLLPCEIGSISSTAQREA